MTFIAAFAVLLLIVVALVWKGTLNTVKELETADQALTRIPSFSLTQRLIGADARNGVAIDEKANAICLFSVGSRLTYRLVPGDRVLSAEIFEDGVSVTKTSRTSQIGGAIIGGLAFGGLGAVVGSLSGKTVTSARVSRIELRLTVDDPQPLHDIVLMNVDAEKDGSHYRAAMQDARQWLGIVQVLIKRAANTSATESQALPQPTASAQATVSVADELQKLAALRASGVLTEQEFQDQKRRTLGD
jgi:hypothetical protein